MGIKTSATLAKVIRLEDSEGGSLGCISVKGQLLGCTLEPDSNDPLKPRIPAGTHLCRRFHGTKYKDTFEIVVDGHKAVLFHSGNTEDDTLMCVLLGQYPGKLKGERAVLNSGNTYKKFMGMLEDYDEFYTQFIDLF